MYEAHRLYIIAISSGTHDIAIIYKLWSSWFGEEGFLKCPHYKPMETIAIQGVASLDHRGMIGKL